MSDAPINADESQPPDSSLWDQEAFLQSAYELLCDVRDATARNLNARLSAAGFGDLTEDHLLILGATFFDGSSRVLTRRLGAAHRAVSQAIETLARRGYLRLPANSDDPSQPAAAFTERGYAALAEARRGLNADLWAQFPRRPGDIIICTVAKSGTTWMQTICALLIFQTPILPARLPELSPWMEGRLGGRSRTYAELGAQRHRRFIKTHVPLNEIPADPRVTYVVVARNPLDTAVSWRHHSTDYAEDNPEQQSGSQPPTGATRQWLLDQTDEMGTSPGGGDSYLDDLLKNLSRAWERRYEPNVLLVHYEELSDDLAGEMRRLAAHLDITVPEDTWPSLLQAATFREMQSSADQLQPRPSLRGRETGLGPATFFRRGSSGEGRALLTEAEAARYRTQAAHVAPEELLAWLHRDDRR